MFTSESNQFYLDLKADTPSQAPVAPPPSRRLRGYAFDPSLSLRVDTAPINRVVFEAPWERVQPGPVGEYIEVLDFDPASGCWYDPVHLDDFNITAQDGVAPSEGNPQFHQQMVYAVAMNTISHFEKALGRKVFWASPYDENQPTGERDAYIQRLRIYPHALRAANAYYSPNKKALLFGYFPGPTGMVFSCLSHDIIAHETTHALLDGMHRRYVEDNNVDALAFHEAFADLVALFQHFTFRDVLKHQIARTRGDLESQSLLGELAQQFGEATGRYGALRNAIGEKGPDGKWMPIVPDPNRLKEEFEPHARGSILVAAVFGAFLAAYRERVSDLIRLATSGTGVLPAGEIHPDLTARLAKEASRTAEDFLGMCIRALDYCPPVDVTFGDYLRAMVTADFDLQHDDRHGYRVALIESFRRWGIMPRRLRTISEEELRWPFANRADYEGWDTLTKAAGKLRQDILSTLYTSDRRKLFEKLRAARASTHGFLMSVLSDSSEPKERAVFERITGLRMSTTPPLEGLVTKRTGMPSFEVHAVRPALRVTPDGGILKQLIVMVTQRRRVAVDPSQPQLGQFDFRGGSTLIFDLESDSQERPSLRYAITQRIEDEDRLAQIRAYWKSRREDRLSLRETYFGVRRPADDDAPAAHDEPFCVLHSEG